MPGLGGIQIPQSAARPSNLLFNKYCVKMLLLLPCVWEPPLLYNEVDTIPFKVEVS